MVGPEDEEEDHDERDRRPRNALEKLRLIEYRLGQAERRLATIESEIRKLEDRVHPIEATAPTIESRLGRVERFILGLLTLISIGVLGALLALINIPKP